VKQSQLKYRSFQPSAFLGGKNEEVLTEHQESSVFSLGYHYNILAGSLSGEEISITICYE